jgi:HEAT repeat protein
VNRRTALVLGLLLASGCGEDVVGPDYGKVGPGLPALWHGRTAEEWLALVPGAPAALRYDAVWAVGELGATSPEALDLVESALGEDDPNLVHAALHAVACLGLAGRPTWAPTVVEHLGAPSNSIVLAAREASARMPAEVVPALVEALRHSEARVRWAAVGALRARGAGAASAAAEVARIVREDPDRSVRKEAAAALARLGPEGSRAAVEALSSEDAATRDAVARSLVAAGAKSVEALLAALAVPGEVRFTAVELLVEIGPPSRPGLEALAAGPDPDLARIASSALDRVKSE